MGLGIFNAYVILGGVLLLRRSDFFTLVGLLCIRSRETSLIDVSFVVLSQRLCF